MSVFDKWETVDFKCIGEIITMICHVKNPEDRGWLEMLGQILQRSDYPKLYKLFNETEDAEFNKLIIDNNTFKLPDYRARYLRNSGVANSANNGGGGGQAGLLYGDAIREIWGTIWQQGNRAGLSGSCGGAFRGKSGDTMYSAVGGPGVVPAEIAFEASRVVPVASENRVFTANVVYYIKAR